ncbi:ubiquitin-associated protein 1 isoform X2 [Nematostella vectensis]|uniref:ubiquitin-associated protein 1 isoform X2 n=1 Tax=Nematostella vectensis TaxID=45351 RepID=UPI0013901943|nr:ubiquitin-associated protein 1 isoform X2 [Nematostella vectensis]
MAFQKTFRKAGSHYSDISALDGIEVKVGPSFQPPAKVALPVGFHLKDPSEILSLTYDFGLEHEVIAKAEKIKAKKFQEEEENEQAKALDNQSNEGPPLATPNLAFSTDILEPTTVTGHGHSRNSSLGGRNSFDLADFENNTSTPFELVELQTINDLDELKDVLLSVSQPSVTVVQTGCSATTGQQASFTSTVAATSSVLNSLSTSVPQMAYAASTTPSYLPSKSTSSGLNFESTSVPQTAYGVATETSYLSSSSGINHQLANSQQMVYGTAAVPTYLPDNTPLGTIGHQNNTNLTTSLSKSVPDLSSNQLVNLADGNETGSVGTGPPLRNAGYNMSHSWGISEYNKYSRHGAPAQPAPMLVDINNGTSPPKLPPKTYNRPRSMVGTPSVNNTVASSDNNITAYPTQPGRLPPLQFPPPIPSSSSEDNKPIPKPRRMLTPLQGSLESNQGSLLEQQGPPVLKPRRMAPPVPHPRAQERVKQHSSPLPPASYPSHPSPSDQSSLPNPLPLLESREKELVNYISIMGFPKPRVARAVHRLGEKDREVIDYLVAVEELSEAGHDGDDVEIAMECNNYDKPKKISRSEEEYIMLLQN